MVEKLKIPLHAKKTAFAELKSRKKSPNNKQIGKISGINQAKFLISNKFITKKKALEFHRFFQRIKNCRTKKCQSAMNLWGGRKFLKNNIFRFVKRNEKKK